MVGYQSDISLQWLDIKSIFHSNGLISKRYFTPLVGYQSDISLQSARKFLALEHKVQPLSVANEFAPADSGLRAKSYP